MLTLTMAFFKNTHKKQDVMLRGTSPQMSWLHP